MRRAPIDTADAACIVPLAIPQGAIVMAPPPAMIGESNCAAYCGIPVGLFHTLAATMARDPACRGAVHLVSGRPKRYAIITADFLRYLRTRCAVPSPIVARRDAKPANDGAAAPVVDEADEVAEQLLREVGAQPGRARR